MKVIKLIPVIDLQFKVLEMMKYVTVSITRVESVIQYTFWVYKYEGNIILY